MRDVLTAPSTRERYTIEERWGGDGPGDRCLGTDRRLERTVLLWTVAAPDGDPRRAALLAHARRCARLTHPVFLRVVDAVNAPDALLVALEAPGGPRLTPEQFAARGLPARAAAELVLQVGLALEQAAAAGLRPRTAALTHLYWDETNGVRIDPLGLLTSDAPPQEAPPLLPALVALLASLLPRAGDAPTGGAVRPFLARWQTGGGKSPDEVSTFLTELRMIAAPLGTAGVGLGGAESGAAAAARTMPPALAAATVPLWAPRLAGSGQTTALAPAAITQPSPAPATRPRQWPGMVRAAVFGALLGMAVFGAAVWGAPSARPDEGTPQSGPAPAVGAPDKASLTLAAAQDARIRVTVDDAPAYTGVLRAGESRSWQGSRRVQVWTADGKVLHVTVNGYPLGALSAAIGHPEWNEVDWGWHAGWKP